jgi:hypothetical protein
MDFIFLMYFLANSIYSHDKGMETSFLVDFSFGRIFTFEG